MIYLISLLQNLLKIVRDGLVTFYKEMVKMCSWIIRNVKSPLSTTLEVIVHLLLMTFMLVVFLLMMVFYAIADNILDFYDYLYKRNYPYKPLSCLTTSYRLVRIGLKKLPRKLYGLKSHLRLPD